MMFKLTVVGTIVCSLAVSDALGGRAQLAAEAKPYKLPLIGWVVVVLFFCSMALIPWVAAVLGRTTTVLSGTITGAFMSLITGLFAGPKFALLVLAFAVPIGFLLDMAVTRDFRRAEREKTRPSWWAGGRWMDAR